MSKQVSAQAAPHPLFCSTAAEIPSPRRQKERKTPRREKSPSPLKKKRMGRAEDAAVSAPSTLFSKLSSSRAFH